MYTKYNHHKCGVFPPIIHFYDHAATGGDRFFGNFELSNIFGIDSNVFYNLKLSGYLQVCYLAHFTYKLTHLQVCEISK